MHFTINCLHNQAPLTVSNTPPTVPTTLSPPFSPLQPPHIFPLQYPRSCNNTTEKLLQYHRKYPVFFYQDPRSLPHSDHSLSSTPPPLKGKGAGCVGNGRGGRGGQGIWGVGCPSYRKLQSPQSQYKKDTYFKMNATPKLMKIHGFRNTVLFVYLCCIHADNFIKQNLSFQMQLYKIFNIDTAEIDEQNQVVFGNHLSLLVLY